MVTVVGSSGWSTSPTLPAGVQQGDLILVGTVRAVEVRGARLVASQSLSWNFWEQGLGGVAMQAWWMFYTGTAPVVRFDSGVPAGQALIVVFRGAAGVGRVRRGALQVPARPNGAGFFMYPSSQAPAGITWSGLAPGWGPGDYQRPPHVRAGWDVSVEGGFVGVAGVFGSAFAVELLPPATPVVSALAPDAGTQVAGPVDVVWSFTGAAGGVQDAFEVRVGTQYWDVAGGAWQGSAVSNPGSVSQTQVSFAGFTLGVPVSWEVRAREGATGLWSPWSDARPVTPVTPPSVTVTGPVAVHDDLTPTVTWTATTPQGAQTAFQVRVTSDGFVYDSGVIAGSASELTVPAQEWVNGASYTPLVRVQQTGGSWSPWAAGDVFVLSWTEPAAPGVLVSQMDEGLLVEVSASVAREVRVERSSPDGWVPLVSYVADAAVHGVRDVFAPWGVPVQYRARQATILDGQTLWSSWAVSAPAENEDHGSYLAVASDPTRTWVAAPLREDGTRTPVRDVTIIDPLGATDPLVMYGQLRGEAGTLVLAQFQQATVAGIVGLLLSGQKLLLRFAPESDLGDTVTVDPLCFVVTDRVGVDRFVQAPYQYRMVQVPFRTTAVPPLGAGRSAPTP